MRQIARKILFGAAFSVSLSSVATAQGVPTFDGSSIAQLIEQVRQMERNYTAQIDQLRQLEDQLSAMTGDRGISNILNSTSDIEARASAVDLDAIMNGAINGATIDGNTSGISDTITNLRSTFELDDLDTFITAPEASRRAIATQAGAGMTAVATAEDTYDRANASMARVTDLIGQIDANTDLKASMDFNTRMLAEVAVLLNENLRLQAAQANAIGTDSLSQARDAAAATEFMRISE